MKRNKQSQHIRRYKSGKRRVVNRGIKKNYGMSTLKKRRYDHFNKTFDKIKDSEELKGLSLDDLRDKASLHFFDDNPGRFNLNQDDGDKLRHFLQHKVMDHEKEIKKRFDLK
jgi:hypothetical protein